MYTDKHADPTRYKLYTARVRGSVNLGGKVMSVLMFLWLPLLILTRDHG